MVARTTHIQGTTDISTHSSLNIPAIVGIAVAAVTLTIMALLIILAGVIIFKRKKKLKISQSNDLQDRGEREQMQQTSNGPPSNVTSEREQMQQTSNSPPSNAMSEREHGPHLNAKFNSQDLPFSMGLNEAYVRYEKNMVAYNSTLPVTV